jgi:hypothetical protein
LSSPLLLPLAVFVFVVAAGQDVVGDGRNEAEIACDVALTGNGNARDTHQTLVMGTGFSGVENCQPAPVPVTTRHINP